MKKRAYTSPRVARFGSMRDLTRGTMGSFNDGTGGGGAGAGMADLADPNSQTTLP
jgi:hypothetical protein